MAGNRKGSGKKAARKSFNFGGLILYAAVTTGSVFGGMYAYDYFQGHGSAAKGTRGQESNSEADTSAPAASTHKTTSRKRDHHPEEKKLATDSERTETADATSEHAKPGVTVSEKSAIPASTLPDPAPMEDGHYPVPSPSRTSTPDGRSEKSPSNAPASPTAPSEKAPSDRKGAAAAIPSGKPVATTADSSPAQPVPSVEISRGAGRRPEVALTFDAGADWRPVKKIISTLAEYGAHSTFFLTGEWVQKNPRSTKLIVGAGNELGNHSWNHPAFTKLSDDEIRSQLRRTESIIEETAGRSSRPYFRPPLGDRDARVRTVVGNEGFFTVYWTFDSRDSVDKGITSEQIRDRVLSKATPGSIVLLHCGSGPTADALPDILRGLKQKGLIDVPVSRLLEE